MLPKKYRLTSDYDFRKIRRKGRSIRTPLFNLNYLVVKSNTPTRFGFVVSAKIDKRATKRNRVKRVSSEAVRDLLPQVKSGFDVVFWMKRGSLEADSKKIYRDIEEALRRGGILGR